MAVIGPGFGNVTLRNPPPNPMRRSDVDAHFGRFEKALELMRNPDWLPSNIKIAYDAGDRAVVEVRYDVSHELADEIRKRMME